MPSDHHAAVGSEHNNNNNNNNNNKTKKKEKAHVDVMKLMSLKQARDAAAAADIHSTIPFSLAPFNPSSNQIQTKAMEMLHLQPDDVLFDLGCGDGRFLTFAATQHPGLRCVGIEIEAEYVCRGRDRVREMELEDRIDIRLGDATKVDTAAPSQPASTTVATITTTAATTTTTTSSSTRTKPVEALTLMEDATALYLFILPKGIAKVMPILNALRQHRIATNRKFKILSYMFRIRDWEATIIDETAKGSCPVYYYEFGNGVGGDGDGDDA